MKNSLLFLFISVLFFNGPAFAQYGISAEQTVDFSAYQPTQIGNDWLIEGDIVIATIPKRSEKSKNGLTGSAIPITKTSRWPKVAGIPTVPYVIDSGLSAKSQEEILQAIASWESYTPIRFVPYQKQSSAIRFVPASGTTCSSSVGRTGGVQKINLAPRCHVGNIIHEIGHALGLWHEQSRDDREKWVTIHLDKVQKKYRSNFIMRKQGKDGLRLGRYDYCSIMHYGPNAFAINSGDITIEQLKRTDGECEKIGQRYALSVGDINAVREMYLES